MRPEETGAGEGALRANSMPLILQKQWRAARFSDLIRSF